MFVHKEGSFRCPGVWTGSAGSSKSTKPGWLDWSEQRNILDEAGQTGREETVEGLVCWNKEHHFILNAVESRGQLQAKNGHGWNDVVLICMC